MISCIFGDNREIFFPKLNQNLHLINLSTIALKYLKLINKKPFICKSEEEARDYFKSDYNNGTWPCFFMNSDTTGEKDFENFIQKET